MKFNLKSLIGAFVLTVIVKLVMTILEIAFPNLFTMISLFIMAHPFQTFVVIALIIIIILLLSLLKPSKFNHWFEGK